MQRFTQTPVQAADRPRAIFEYTVTGRGTFPFDMLRYDSCWPADGEAAAKFDDHNLRELRTIRLRSYSEPTIARWASFIWSVGHPNAGHRFDATQIERTAYGRPT